MSANPTGENPYASPAHSAGAQDPRKLDAPRFRVWAVLAGWGVDMGFSLVAGTALAVVGLVQLMADNVPPERWQTELNEQNWYLISTLVVGVGGTVLGGYLAAFWGKDFPLRHAAAVGIIELVIGLIMIVLMPEAMPLWYAVFSLLITVPVAMLGGYLRLRQTESKKRSATAI